MCVCLTGWLFYRQLVVRIQEHENEIADWVIDVDSGFRELNDDSSYRGECQISETPYAITCSYERDFLVQQVYIYLADLTASLYLRTHLASTLLRTCYGKCTEI